MTVVINGNTGIVSPGVDSTNLILDGSTSGSITMLAPAVAGTNTQTLVATTGTLAPIVSGTAVTASGTSVNFTDIPPWVKRITVMLSGVSTNGTSNIIIQLGDSGGIENTGYTSYSGYSGGTNSAGGVSSTAGFITFINTAASVIHGHAVFTLSGSNLWVGSHAFGLFTGSIFSTQGGGNKTLSDTLDRVRVTTVNGTDTFDAGTINIIYE